MSRARRERKPAKRAASRLHIERAIVRFFAGVMDDARENAEILYRAGWPRSAMRFVLDQRPQCAHPMQFVQWVSASSEPFDDIKTRTCGVCWKELPL